MIKESTRKGWAGVAAIVLAFFGLTTAVAPAQAAASSITIAPAVGTSTTGILDHYFVLKTTASAPTSSDIRYFIEGAVTTDFTGDVVFANSTDNLTPAEVVNHSSDTTADLELIDADDNQSSINTVSGSDGTWVTGNAQYLAIALTGSSEKTIKITPFEDNIQKDGEITSSEAKGNTIEVTFKKASDVTVNTALKMSSIGGTADAATVTFTDVNMTSIRELAGGDILGKVKYILDGNTEEEISYDVTDYTKASGGFVVDNTSSTWTQTAASVLSASANLEGESYGTAVLGSIGSSPAASLDALSYKGQYVDYASDTSGDLRAGAGTLSMTATVVARDGESVANHPVEFKIAETDVATATGASFTANGVTFSPSSSSSTESETITVNADADGEATVTFNYSGVESGDTVIVTASTQVNASGSTNSASVTLTGQDSTPTNVVDNDRVTGYNVATVGSTTSYGYTVKDQFGMTYTAKPTRLQWTYNNAPGVGTQSANGVHTINVVDNNTAAAVETLDITTVDTYVGSTPTGVSINQDPKTVDVVTSLATPARVVIALNTASNKDNSTDAASSASLAEFDERDRASGDLTATTFSSFDVTVYDSKGALMPGAEVTLSGPDTMYFADDVRQAAGDFVIRTSASGKATVNFATNSTAKQTFTATAGSASDSEFVDFAEKTALSDIANVELTAPDSVQAGSTLKVVATFTDKFGNPVNTGSDSDSTALTYTGPGLVVGDIAKQTDSNGQITANVLMGSNESGTATVVAFGDPGDNKTVVNDNITVTKTITVGEGTAEEVDYGTMSAWTVNQDDGTAKVYVKFPTIGEKVRIGHQKNGSGSYETIYVKTTSSETMDGLRIVEGVGTYVVRTIDLVDGTNRIRVTVGDSTEVQVRYNE